MFPLWARDNWKGLFDIEWLLIKDVPFREFRNVKCEPKEKKQKGEYSFINYSIKSLLYSPDCQKLPLNEEELNVHLASTKQVGIDFDAVLHFHRDFR